MPQTIEVQAFSFDELSDEAKERARSWYREHIDNNDFEPVIDDFIEIAEIIGVDFRTHQVQLIGGKTRSEPNIYWSCSCSQGDGACFEGDWAYDPTAVQRIRDYCNDEKLFEIVDELTRINNARLLLNKPSLSATIRHSGNYYHEHSTDIVVGDSSDEDDAVISDEEQNAVEEAMRNLMRWLYSSLREQQDYLYSDEAVDENIEANEYMFDEDGDRHAYA
jgi:hypothetical protein